MNKSNTLIILALCLFSLCTPSLATETPETWIDVRSEKEYNEGHLTGAINLPLDILGDIIGKAVQDKNTKLRLYCRSGRRSELAKKELVHLGYTNVVNNGGMKAIIESGLKKEE